MRIKTGAVLSGLHLLMRPVLRESERIWKKYGRDEGVTVTSALDGTHGAASWHYYGLAVDLRSKYFDQRTSLLVLQELKQSLPQYDVIFENDHYHIEPSNKLAEVHGLMI